MRIQQPHAVPTAVRAAAVTALAVLAVGCSSSTSSAPAGGGQPIGPAAGSAASTGPSNAGPTDTGSASSSPASSSPASSSTGASEPSAASKMVCEAEAANDIYAAVRVRTGSTPAASWRDHLYSCRYSYPGAAVMVLSVKELPTEAAAISYFTTMQRSFPSHTARLVADQQAFTASTGSVFVRKDAKVLEVDVSRLPARFGQPPYPRAVVAYTVAAVIMGCWSGS